MNDRITRRSLLAAAAAVPAAAQQPAAPPIPATPAEESAAVQAQLRSNFELMRKVNLPLATEPATHFEA